MGEPEGSGPDRNAGMPLTRSDSFDLGGRVALVTGAGGGLGRAIAHGLSGSGAAVGIIDIDGEAAARVAEELASSAGPILSIQADVSDERAAERAVAQIADALGTIDILVANAGIASRAAAVDMTVDQWDRVMAVNLRGVFIFNRLIGRQLLDRRRPGSIVNIASIAGQVGLPTGVANYSASKGGVIALTRCLAIEWAASGIRVNAVAPSHTRTPLISDLIDQDPNLGNYFRSNIPMGRLASEADIVGPVLFLASDSSSFITGHVLNVDGGHTAR